MKLLLDTCVFLWLAVESDQLSEKVKEMFQDPENEVYLSAASTWEIAIKYSLNKLTLPNLPEVCVPELREKYGVKQLAIFESATLHVRKLPPLHNDPFDRMLVAQAILEDMTILTPDKHIIQYGVLTRW